MRFGAARRAVAFWLLAYAFAAAMLGTTIPTPLYPIYQHRFGFSSLMITVIFAVYAGGVIGGLLLFGGLSDTLGRRTVLLPGLGLSAAAAVAFLLAGGLAPILLGRVLSGLSAGIFTGTATAALVDLAPDDRRTFATLIAVAANVGGLGLGTLLSGLLAEYAPGPLRLAYAVDLALVALAAIGVWAAPETVAVTRPARLRPQRLGVPAEVRAIFVRAAVAGACAFAVSGVYGAVAPELMATVLHDTSHALAGVLVFVVFMGSVAGQAALPAMPARLGLPAGCVLLTIGIGLLATATALGSLGLLFASAVAVGLGQGIVIGAGLAAINRDAPPARRGETASAFFVALYCGLALPVVGVGVATELLGLRSAAYLFSAAVGTIVVVVLASTLRGKR